MIIFEEPLNEHMRICLRLEHLLEQTTQYIDGTDPWSSRIALSSILEIFNVIDRPDLKSKFAKALAQHSTSLSLLKNKDNIDQNKLEQVLSELDELNKTLYYDQDRTTQLIRSNTFLTNIRQHMANPAGACAFSTPAYHLWLHNPPVLRRMHLKAWLSEFDQIGRMAKLLLKLTRNSATPQKVIAERGFYYQPLNSKLDYHLIRVVAPPNSPLYPEISVGKHRLNIRFMNLDTDQRSIQCMDDVEFSLTCCLPYGSAA